MVDAAEAVIGKLMKDVSVKLDDMDKIENVATISANGDAKIGCRNSKSIHTVS